MSTPKKVLQLVNYEGQQPLDIRFGDSSPTDDDWRYCDIDLTGNGNFRTISAQEAMVQTSLKNIFTEKQASGYGTNIYELIGEMDVVVRRIGLVMDITMSMIAMKGFLDAQFSNQELSADDLLATVSQLSVVDDSENPSTTRVKMSLLSNSGVTTPIGVL